MIYKTIQGDTWDRIAKKTLGSEYLLDVLLDENPQYREIVIFSAGASINIPVIPDEDLEVTPPWLRGDD